MSRQLKAGAAEVNITPPVGVPLTGFAGRPSGAVGIHDDLYAKALVLDDGSTKIAIVTTDLLGLDFSIVSRARQLIEAQTGILGKNVMLSSSHTHSGPATTRLHGLGDQDDAYIDILTRKLVGAVYMAANNCVEAKWGAGRGEVQIGVNRRQMTPDRGMILGRNPEGPVAPYVDVLRVDDLNDKPLAILFSHAAHPVVLGANNLLITADYPGYAMRLVKKILGEGVVTMFAQGCCGNINSDPVGGTFEDARRLGTILGAEVVKTMEQIRTVSEVTLKSLSQVIGLPLQEPPAPEEAEKILESQRGQLEEVKKRSTNIGEIKLYEGLMTWAEKLLALSKEGKKERFQDFEIHAMALNDTAIVGLAGEVFVEYQLYIDKRSPYKRTLVFGYTNGCIGYVPTAEAYPQGGYEVETAYKYYGTLMLKPESEELIRTAAVNLLGQLQEL